MARQFTRALPRCLSRPLGGLLTCTHTEKYLKSTHSGPRRACPETSGVNGFQIRPGVLDAGDVVFRHAAGCLGQFFAVGGVGEQDIFIGEVVDGVRQVQVVVGDGQVFVLILGHVAIGVVQVVITNDGVFIFEAPGDVPGVRHGDETVGDGGAVGVCEVVDGTEGAGRGGEAPAGVGFQIPVQVVSDVRFGIVVCKCPTSAAVGIVVGGGKAVGGIVGETVLLLSQAGGTDVGAPLHGGNISVVLGRTPARGRVVTQLQFEQVAYLVAGLGGAARNVVDAGKPAPDIVQFYLFFFTILICHFLSQQ